MPEVVKSEVFDFSRFYVLCVLEILRATTSENATTPELDVVMVIFRVLGFERHPTVDLS